MEKSLKSGYVSSAVVYIYIKCIWSYSWPSGLLQHIKNEPKKQNMSNKVGVSTSRTTTHGQIQDMGLKCCIPKKKTMK